MRPLLRLAAGAMLLLASPAEARAESDGEKAERERRANLFDQIRLSLDGTLASGTSLVGAGSVGRYHRAGVALDLEVHRLFRPGVGFGMVFQGLPSPASGGSARDLLFGRAEGYFEVAPGAWGGALPGSVVLGAGFGGDGARYWFSENGRFYGVGFARLRLFLTKRTRVQLTYTAVPVALATSHVRLHEHRFELATSVSLFQIGARLAYTFTRGGEPVRDFFQQEIGAFAGISVY